MTLEEALAKIAKLEAKIDGMVPKARLDSKNDTIAKIEQERDEARAKLSEMPDPTKAEKRYQRLEKRYEELQSEYSGAKQQWETSQALTAAGIADPDDQDIVLHRYSKLGEDAPALSEWLTAEDGARGDKVLSRILPDANGSAEGDQGGQQGGTTQHQRPASNSGVQQTQPGKVTTLEQFATLPPSYRTSEEGRAHYQRLLESS